ncbi:hypothetical protein [Noviherbaspirillum malthae]|uniref:hypothetical protein n=1 Tax=Noviherbaspirillum malthae TaxID=1260987 RepID=UPI00188F3D80|nr:hypothetical protein [Noviherbaspirillum malthae]
MVVYRDLLGDLVLRCVWGGLRSRHENTSHVYVADIAAADAMIEAIGKRHLAHQYRPVHNAI